MQTAIWSIDTMIGNVAALTAQQVNYQQSAAFNTHAQKLVLKTSGGVIKGHAGAIHCTRTCTLKVSGGSKLHLEAEPRKGYEFKGWQGACNGNAPRCSVWVDRKKEVKAVFGARGYHH
jgi:Divergent InlB B-repeat domain